MKYHEKSGDEHHTIVDSAKTRTTTRTEKGSTTTIFDTYQAQLKYPNTQADEHHASTSCNSGDTHSKVVDSAATSPTTLTAKSSHAAPARNSCDDYPIVADPVTSARDMEASTQHTNTPQRLEQQQDVHSNKSPPLSRHTS
jgi:hypothetical protein